MFTTRDRRRVQYPTLGRITRLIDYQDSWRQLLAGSHVQPPHVPREDGDVIHGRITTGVEGAP